MKKDRSAAETSDMTKTPAKRSGAKPRVRPAPGTPEGVAAGANDAVAEAAGEQATTPKRARAASAKPASAKPASSKPKAAKARTAKAKTAKSKAAAKADGKSSANGRSLVIVESPTKSRTLTKFLGRNFSVIASNGHIMDLPKSKLGVDLDKDFEPEYVPIRGKAAALQKIKDAAKVAERIYLAPDPDREGEAIAWHLAGVLRNVKGPIMRLTFNEITERAVKLALEAPRDLNMNLVNAQQARRVLDRLVGYKVSPFVWRTVRYGLSAGRVQSVALRLICEREEAIRAFVPEEYWTLEADFETTAGDRFTARLVREGQTEIEQGQLRGEDAGARAQALAEELLKAEARVATVESAPRFVHPKAPFITSTLQQTAFNRLGYGSQRTMALAQQLYEGQPLGDEGSVGLITYMRTDAPRLADEAIGAIRGWLGQNFGPDYVPEAPRTYKSRKSAQEAHEAIRPTAIERTPQSVRPFLSDELFRLYELIWTRAVASQAASAKYLATTVEIAAGRLGLRATGRVLEFAGFQKLYGIDEEDDASESRLPQLTANEPLRLATERLGTPKRAVSDQDLSAEERAHEDAESAAMDAARGPRDVVRPEQHFTQPPPRYSEASLVKALEEENIGRPSTYASIVSTITSREYVNRDKGRLKPTDLGMAVNRLLVDTFPDVFNVKFTAEMEEELDEIEDGQQEWHRVVHDFWGPFSKDLAKAEKDAKEHRTKVEEASDIDCSNCGRKLVKKFGRRGPFLACPGYPECKFTRPVDDAELPVPVDGTCPECGSGLVARNGPYGRFIHCSKRPECKFTKPFTLGIKCPQCGEGEIAERRTKRGKVFFGCTRYPACDFAVWDRPRETPCPSCGAAFLVEKETKQGTTLRCVQCKSSFDPDTIGARSA